jgi:hypothetical protein
MVTLAALAQNYIIFRNAEILRNSFSQKKKIL